MGLLEKKVAVITGASSGIGKKTAEIFAKEGAVVVLAARRLEKLHEVENEIREKGGEALTVQADVSKKEDCDNLIEAAVKAYGRVDILVNNAGITRDGLILSMKEEDFDAVLNTNLKGAFYLTRHLYSHFMRKRSGRILNISSVVGLHGNAGQANYAAAKAGLIGLTKSTAKELAGRGVTCNAIAPGYIESDMTAALPEKARQAILGSIPAKRPGNPEDVAALVAFLAGENASYITGEVIRVDGGMGM